MKTNCLLPVLVFLCLLTGCAKDGADDEPDYRQFAPEALEYLTIPVGRYFIYEDSMTRERDSVVLQTCDLKKCFEPERKVMSPGPLGHEETIPAYHYQEYTLSMAKPVKDTLENWLTATVSNQYSYAFSPFSWEKVDLWGKELMGDQTERINRVFMYPYDPAYVTRFDMAVVGTMVYKDMLEVRATDGYSYHWWVKEVGIVKRVLYDPSSYNWQVLNLVKWGVIK